MTDLGLVSASSMTCIVVGLLLSLLGPIVIAIVWGIRKKEPASTMLIGAAAFILFVLILEKPIQNALLYPTLVGRPDNALSIWANAHPLVLALLIGLFPGVFEETGRLIVFKTVLKKRQNRETAISYGIGHGGIEVIMLLGLTYVNNLIYALMINSGRFQTMVDQVAVLAPAQVDQLYQVAAALTTFSGGTMLLGMLERVWAVLFHLGESILVFYACKDKRRFRLYPLAILLHTVMDGIAALAMVNLVNIPVIAMEAIFAVFGIAVFVGGYLLLYRKDEAR